MENTIVIHGLQVAEQVAKGDLKPNAPFYLENPFENINASVHYTCENLDADTPVWVVFSKWELDAGRNPCIEGEPIRGAGNIGAALFSGLDHSLCR